MSKLRHNVEVLQAITPGGCRLMPAVKSNGYGLGAVEISRELNRLNVEAFCVATLEEGIELRENGVRGDILILGYTPADCAPELKIHKLTQTVVAHTHAKQLAQQGYNLPVHIKIDTGMHRLGERAEHTEAIRNIFALDGIQIKGVYTKLACCGSKQQVDIEYTEKQLRRFWQLLAEIRRRGAHPEAHAQCSYGMINYPGCYAYVRPGAAIYGIVDEDACVNDVPPLKEIFEVKTRIAQLKEIYAGECVGYDQAFIAPHTMRLAAITAGYADGLPRGLSCGVGRVLVNGKFAPIVGKVCMDQAIIDVSGIGSVKPGDAVTLIGCEGDNRITVHDIARWADTIPNEIVSRLGSRMQRIYRESMYETQGAHRQQMCVHGV